MKDCKKYSEWLKDAALGELSGRSDRELLAHAAECDACREAYEHAREVGASVDRAVESLVRGEPSPQFAARLQARIAEEGTHRRVGWWTWPVLASAAVAILAAVVLTRPPQRPTPEQIATNVPAQPTASTASHSNSIPPPAGKLHARAGSTQRASVPGPQLASRNAHAAQAEVIVQPGQLRAIAQFAEAIHSGRIDAEQLVAAQKRSEKPLEISPIEIKPLEQPPATEGSPDTTADSGRP